MCGNCEGSGPLENHLFSKQLRFSWAALVFNVTRYWVGHHRQRKQDVHKYLTVQCDSCAMKQFWNWNPEPKAPILIYNSAGVLGVVIWILTTCDKFLKPLLTGKPATANIIITIISRQPTWCICWFCFDMFELTQCAWRCGLGYATRPN